MTKFAALMALAIVLVPSAAWTDGSGVDPTPTGFLVNAWDSAESQTDSGGGAPVTHVEGEVLSEPVCLIGGSQTCDLLAECDDGTTMVASWFETTDGDQLNQQTNCPQELEVADQVPTVTPGLVLEALRRIGLPESELVIQPPNGRTLVNFETNFYTERDEFTRVVNLLGRRVELRIWPAQFGWSFGDGEERWTTSPGDEYPNLEVTHRYLSKGRVSPSVATTYAAQFRVGGGPWRDVNGTVTIPGTPQGLRVVTARPVLVGGS